MILSRFSNSWPSKAFSWSLEFYKFYKVLICFVLATVHQIFERKSISPTLMSLKLISLKEQKWRMQNGMKTKLLQTMFWITIFYTHEGCKITYIFIRCISILKASSNRGRMFAKEGTQLNRYGAYFCSRILQLRITFFCEIKEIIDLINMTWSRQNTLRV